MIIALTLGPGRVSWPAPRSFPFWRWWFWLILGRAGEVALVWSSIKEPEFRARAVAEMFREKFKPGTSGTMPCAPASPRR